MIRTHVMLVSDQLLPNLIPALMEAPDRALLVASDNMIGKGKPDLLRDILERKGCSVEIRGGVPSAGLSGIRKFAFGIASELSERQGRIVLNATGGNKLMSLAFVEEFRESLGDKLQIIYTDTAHNAIEMFWPRGSAPRPLESVLDIPGYLEAQGMTCRGAVSDDREWKETARARKALTKYLGENAAVLEDFIGAVNYLAHQALGEGKEPGLFCPEQEFKSRPRGRWEKAVKRIAATGMVEWDCASKLGFSDAGSARYLNGFWLEEYVWHIASDCGFDDVRCGVEGTWQANVAKKDAPRNEFDLLVVHNNRMLVVECKTLRMNNPESGSEQAIINKLESLGRNAGGTFGTSLLVSARRASDTIRNRCKNFSIPLREGKELKHLRQDLMHWKEGERMT